LTSVFCNSATEDTGILVKTEPEDGSSITETSTPTSGDLRVHFVSLVVRSVFQFCSSCRLVCFQVLDRSIFLWFLFSLCSFPSLRSVVVFVAVQNPRLAGEPSTSGARPRLASTSSVTFSDSGEGGEGSLGGDGGPGGAVGPPPYKCPYCPKEFVESKAFLRHRDRTHASVSRPCPDCDATFKR
jgi:hypothetical protein